MEARPAYAQRRGRTSSRGICTQSVLPGDGFFIDTSPQTTIFGVTHPAPIFIAPVGAHGLMHGDGELGTARAAAKVGVPLIVSSAASRSMEEIAEAQGPNGHRWYQLYWSVHPSFLLPKADPPPEPVTGRTLSSSRSLSSDAPRRTDSLRS